MDLHLWLAFVAASLALLVIPGPTLLLVVSYALTQGRRVALAMAAGVALGDLLAMSASLLGLGALVATSATLFTILKWVGAVYLVWMGIGLWRSAGKAGLAGLSRPEDLPAGQVFRHAALVTVLNPKSIAFFVAFVPQFITPGAPLAPQFTVMIATFVSMAALNALLFALLANRMRRFLTTPRSAAGVTRLGGAALVGMGLMTATLRRA
ncbi:LysE family translocator [Pararhodobacter sp. CCB-MM2]|uniref:LysE family translocator n=1 Tax=Pararhodobacter sp. CCB-MM2 TaxID=1786003 RepID=UPI00082E8C72|nr:LysE family translocator [Pararhodobacter sp. CCB-MM2]